MTKDMEINVIKRDNSSYPLELAQLHKPPAAIYHQGRALSDILSRPRVAIVGSRAISPYGRQVTHTLAKQLAEQGVVVISGLAYGVDATAHQAALDAGGITMAVLPSPIEQIAPSGNQRLARQILNHGGALISSYARNHPNHKGNFVERNEYVAALSNIVVITEAAQKSGSLHTASFALARGVTVMAVPGNITSKMSAGTNQLLASGAGVVTGAKSVLKELGLGTQLQLSVLRGDTPAEQQLIDLIAEGITDGQELLERSGQNITLYNQTLTMLEISGKIRPLGGNHWGLG